MIVSDLYGPPTFEITNQENKDFIEALKWVSEENLFFEFGSKLSRPYSNEELHKLIAKRKSYADKIVDFSTLWLVEKILIDATHEVLAEAYQKDPSKKHLRQFITERLEIDLGI